MTIVYDKELRTYALSLGAVGTYANLMWHVSHTTMLDGRLVFSAGLNSKLNHTVSWVCPLALDKYLVIPTEVWSPAHIFIANSYAMHYFWGVVLVQEKLDSTRTPMEHAALNCFWTISFDKL